jgi:hypothetical protein
MAQVSQAERMVKRSPKDQYKIAVKAGVLKGIVSKLTIKFWMCQKYGKMKDYNNKNTTSAVE